MTEKLIWKRKPKWKPGESLRDGIKPGHHRAPATGNCQQKADEKRLLQQMPATREMTLNNCHTKPWSKSIWRRFYHIFWWDCKVYKLHQPCTRLPCIAIKNPSTQLCRIGDQKYEHIEGHEYNQPLGSKVDIDTTMYDYKENTNTLNKDACLLPAAIMDCNDFRPTWATPRLRWWITTWTLWTTRS